MEDCGYLKNSDKNILVKPLKKIIHKFPKYAFQNILLLEESPYQSYINPFYSTLFPTFFRGNTSDLFLKDILSPFLCKLSESSNNIFEYTRENYPSWSKKSLEIDWKSNKVV
jgi:hypothetical protein